MPILNAIFIDELLLWNYPFEIMKLSIIHWKFKKNFVTFI